MAIKSGVLEWLDQCEGDMIALLETIVNIDSGSYDKAGVDAVGAAIAAFLNAYQVPNETLAIEGFGNALRANVGGGGGAGGVGGNRPIVLMGHRDTVFPKGEAAKRPFKIENGRAYGPGVADMKAGLVMNAFVLAAFAKFGGAPMPLVGLFTGDEEIGSTTSRPVIEATARDAAMVFNSEPGRASGNIVTARKGGIFFIVELVGVAAHSGGQFEKGRSAILELAYKIAAWNELVDLDAGITLNVGLISGGQSVNTVAPHARCEIDVRYVTNDQRDKIVGEVRRIAETHMIDGVSATFEIRGEFRPLNPTEASDALFQHYVKGAAELGMTIEGEFTGGCADSGFTAGVGTPTICAVGPVGGLAHSPDEYLEVASLVPRAKAVALAILTAGNIRAG